MKLKRKLNEKFKKKKRDNDESKDERNTSSNTNRSSTDSTASKSTNTLSKLLKIKKKKKKEDEESDTTTSSGEEGSDSDEDAPMKMATDKGFGKKKFVDVDQPAIWNVMIRVIEGKDVDSGSLRVRAILDSRQKATRPVTQTTPRWRQNLLFTTKKESLKKLASRVLTLKLTRARTLGESVLGQFTCSLSSIIHSSDRAVISKWIALTSPGDDEDEGDADENCGFLKVSLVIYRHDESPPLLPDNDGSEEVWSGALLVEYTLKLRLFRMSQMSQMVIDDAKKKSMVKTRKPAQFFIVVTCGEHKAQTTDEALPHEMEQGPDELVFEQELYLPITWPTVLSKIEFAFYMKKGKKKRCLGQASIPLRSIYEPGEDGYMPTFGPAFLNFYGAEKMLRLKWFKERNLISEDAGSRYLGRLLVGVDCVEYMGETAISSFLDYASIKQGTTFQATTEKYLVCCSMQACNMINPLFASDPLKIYVSIANYGSCGWDQRENASSTFGAMPNTDGCKYFAMPWGNMRPMIEIPCSFEDVDARIERCNALTKVVNMLDAMIWTARRVGDSEHDQCASYGIEALDYIQQLTDRLIEHHRPDDMTTTLDENNETTRAKSLKKLRSEINDMRYDVQFQPEEMVPQVLRILTRLRQVCADIASDAQISLPDILIKLMTEGGKLIGYSRIPVSEVYDSSREAFAGEWSGKVRTMHLRWPAVFDHKNRREQFPAVLHARVWFGREEKVERWRDLIEPAEFKSFVEAYQLQKRGAVSQNWKEKFPYVDEDGEDVGNLIEGRVGWKFVGNWLVRNSHDMWMSDITGRPTVNDKALEVEKRDSDNKWKFYRYTEFFGNELSAQQMNATPEGWEYSSNWQVDKHRNNGDKNGWIYSTSGIFWGEREAVDKEERPEHKYRRRFIRRIRSQTKYNKDHENLQTLKESLEDKKWEYARKMTKAFHDLESPGDDWRRRRFIMEVQPEKSEGQEIADPSYHRLYEAHLLTTRWQLRCYLMWAKDLLPIVKQSSRAFIRIFFAHHARQTLVVENSQNPIWNETVIFDNVLIPGGMRDITHYPPVIVIEVRGECTNETEVFLGSFETRPTVICSPADSRAIPHWYPLQFQKGKTRGAVLCCFELFEAGVDKDHLPLMPAKKSKSPENLDIPSELRPQFAKFSVQLMCWGVRNLKRHNLITVKKPFLEVTIGDQEITLDPLKNAKKNPNFDEPMIVFPEVALPAALELSPPLVVNLYDARAFRRRPLIGVCIISDFNKYIRKMAIKKNEEKEKVDWAEYNEALEENEELLASTPHIPSLRQERMPELDWWSRYYCSLGQLERSPGYLESGMEFIRFFPTNLEAVGNYNNFSDFLDTFPFVKSAKGDFDDPEEKEKTGELKAKLLITRLHGNTEKSETVDPPGVEFLGPVQCLVRLYVIEAKGLVTSGKSGICDPYIVARCGKQKVNLKKNYRADSVDPVFGELIEMCVNIPVEKDLVVSVMEKRRLRADEEIGTTTIDLENRLLTKWRATTGLSQQFTIQGEMQWRDQLSPMAVLRRYCKKMMLSAPKIESRDKDGKKDCGITLLGITFWHSEVVETIEKDEKHIWETQREAAGADEKESSEKEVKEEEDAKSQRPEMKNDGTSKVTRERSKSETIRSSNKSSEKKLTVPEMMSLRKKKRRAIVGTPLQTVALFILHQTKLVPEHVESRSLTSAMTGTMQVGRLRMFVDIFPKELGPVPPAYDIEPRKPEKYQLRVAIMNVTGAIPIKRSFGEPLNDIYIKVFVNGMLKSEKTDVHFRSLDGNGEFNWRILINIDYNPWEHKVVSYQKTRMFRKAHEELADPLIVVQMWDKQGVKKDKMLGEFEFDLEQFMGGITDPDYISHFTRHLPRKRGCCSCSRKCCCIVCCVFCWQTRCMLCPRRKKKTRFPKPKKYVEPKHPEYVSLFEAERVTGWWPMLTDTYPHNEEDKAAKKKKNDDEDMDDLNTRWVMGLVEMDVSLVTEEEAKAEPLGKKRKEPNHSPHLDKPHRSKWNKFWFLSRVKPCLKYFWVNYGIQIVYWICFILFLMLFFYLAALLWPPLYPIFSSIFK